MGQWPRPWRILAYSLISLAVVCWAAAGISLGVGLGPPSRSGGFVASAALSAIGLLLVFAAVGARIFLARTHRIATAPANPERLAAIRRSVHWVWLSYVPMTAGIACLIFAVRQWPGHRGVFLSLHAGGGSRAANRGHVIRNLYPGHDHPRPDDRHCPCHPRIHLAAALNHVCGEANCDQRAQGSAPSVRVMERPANCGGP